MRDWSSSLLKHNDLYGYQSKIQLTGQASKIDVNIFRNPVEEMNETHRFIDALTCLVGREDCPSGEITRILQNPET